MEQIKRRTSWRLVAAGTPLVMCEASIVTRGTHQYECGLTAVRDVVVISELTGKTLILPMQVIIDMAIAEGIDIDDQPPSPAVGSAA